MEERVGADQYFGHYMVHCPVVDHLDCIKRIHVCLGEEVGFGEEVEETLKQINGQLDSPGVLFVGDGLAPLVGKIREDDRESRGERCLLQCEGKSTATGLESDHTKELDRVHWLPCE